MDASRTNIARPQLWGRNDPPLLQPGDTIPAAEDDSTKKATTPKTGTAWWVVAIVIFLIVLIVMVAYSLGRSNGRTVGDGIATATIPEPSPWLTSGTEEIASPPGAELVPRVLKYPLSPAGGWRQLPPLVDGAVFTQSYNTNEGVILSDLCLSLCEGCRLQVTSPFKNASGAQFNLRLNPSSPGESYHFTAGDFRLDLTSSDDSLTFAPQPNQLGGHGDKIFTFVPRKDYPATWVHLERIFENFSSKELVPLPGKTDRTHIKVAMIPLNVPGKEKLKASLDVQIRRPTRDGQPFTNEEWRRGLARDPTPPEVVLYNVSKNVVSKKRVQYYDFAQAYRAKIPESELSDNVYILYIRPIDKSRWRVGLRYRR